MFVLCTIEIITLEIEFFYFEHKPVSRKRPEVSSLGVLLIMAVINKGKWRL